MRMTRIQRGFFVRKINQRFPDMRAVIPPANNSNRIQV
jgi:hypothetical protein